MMKKSHKVTRARVQKMATCYDCGIKMLKSQMAYGDGNIRCYDCDSQWDARVSAESHYDY